MIDKVVASIPADVPVVNKEKLKDSARQFEALPSLLPELVYIALLPYAGQETALAQARLSQ